MTKNRIKIAFHTRHFHIVISLMLAFLMTSCSNTHKNTSPQNQPTSHWKTYQSDSLHFAISYPPLWELRPDAKNHSISLFEPLQTNTDDFQDNLLLWVEAMPLAIKDSLYAKAAITQLRISNPSISIEEDEQKQLDKNRFHTFHFNFTTKDSNHYQAHGYVLSKGTRGYNFSCTSDKKTPHSIATFDSILSTFNPLP